MRLRCDRTAPRRARRALDQLDAIEPVRDDALLVASELATNALKHAIGDPDSELELVAEVVPDGLRIAVSDTSGSGPSSGPLPTSEAGADALGLRIVQGVARRWGAERVDGQTLWAVVPTA